MSEKESQSELLLFEVETSKSGQQSVKRVVRECSVEKAAALLKVSRSSVLRLYRAGIITGWQPGLALARLKALNAGKDAATVSKNCKVVLDWDSVIEYREVERKAQALCVE